MEGSCAPGPPTLRPLGRGGATALSARTPTAAPALSLLNYPWPVPVRASLLRPQFPARRGARGEVGMPFVNPPDSFRASTHPRHDRPWGYSCGRMFGGARFSREAGAGLCQWTRCWAHGFHVSCVVVGCGRGLWSWRGGRGGDGGRGRPRRLSRGTGPRAPRLRPQARVPSGERWGGLAPRRMGQPPNRRLRAPRRYHGPRPCARHEARAAQSATDGGGGDGGSK